MKKNRAQSIPLATHSPILLWRSGSFVGFSPFCSLEEQEKLYRSSSFSWKGEHDYWLKEIDNISQECAQENWEEGAEKVSSQTILNAKNLLKCFISHTILVKNIAPACDGSVGFNWRNDKFSICVSVKDNDFVYYTRMNRKTKEPSFLAVKLYEFEKLISDLLEKFLYDSNTTSYSQGC